MKLVLKKRTLIIFILFIGIFNIFYVILHELPEETNNLFNSTTQTGFLSIKSPMKGNVTHYRSVDDTSYHYEFRYKLNINNTEDNQRLIILLNGNAWTCEEYWEFLDDHHILSTFHDFHYSILIICSVKKNLNVNYGSIQNNLDVQWIYLSLRQWMNEIYYQQFRQYPRLYIYNTNHDSNLAALLSRVLPIQAQILTISSGDFQSMLTRSDHHIDIQTRLQLDPIFANWFYFDFCYYTKMGIMKTNEICPFQSKTNNLQPLSPTYFISLQDNSIINNTRKYAFQLGGILLNDTQSLKFHTVSPLNTISSYRSKGIDIWNSKLYASEFFRQHLYASERYRSNHEGRQTCWCLTIDFRFYELYPNITETWSKQKQEEYNDYVRDIKRFEKIFCKNLCNDLLSYYTISSKDLIEILNWINTIDNLRSSFYIKDYLNRPLRIWMYEKDLLNIRIENFTLNEPNWLKTSKPYQMYSPEYYLQDYFQRLKISKIDFHRNFKWTNNPLLADYFIIPSDLMFYYSISEPASMTNLQFQNLRDKLNYVYFEPLLKGIQILFRYWTMGKHENTMGSNHIIIMVGGRNMGFLYNHIQNILKNVIQLVFTGIRQDLSPSYASSPYTYRGMTIVYRHGYDVVIPQFTPLKLNASTLRNLTTILQKKKRLFFFAGNLAHSMNDQSARSLLSSLWKNIRGKQRYNMTIDIQGKQYDTMMVIDGHMKPIEYIESIQSSIFSLCPEGFLPWSPRLYEAIQIGAIPIILADNIVLPFERFIDWSSFSTKINVSNIQNMINYAYQIPKFENYIQQKLQNAVSYFYAFQWPYSFIDKDQQKKHVFISHEDQYGTVKNVFHYISLELRCRRLEQHYGLTSDSFSMKSKEAQQYTCKNHPIICPCHDTQRTTAFREYI